MKTQLTDIAEKQTQSFEMAADKAAVAADTEQEDGEEETSEEKQDRLNERLQHDPESFVGLHSNHHKHARRILANAAYAAKGGFGHNPKFTE